MKIRNLGAEIGSTSYPGRGIVAGLHEDGKTAVLAYFIMGRSVNSRNRIFVAEGDEMRTRAYDESKLSDPSLIIYWPVRVLPGAVIVTNGDQTDTVRDFMKDGKSFEDALMTRTFEPDGPNWTPRISALAELEGDYSYRLSILKSADGDASSAERFFFNYEHPRAGVGHFIHTYQGDGNPLPSFEGEPVPVTVKGTLDEFTQEIWENLDRDNRVSLFTRYIDLASGKAETRIVNVNEAGK